MDHSNSLAQNPHFKLTSRQEELLFAALNSNNKTSATTDTYKSQANNNTSGTMAQSATSVSPLQQVPPSSDLNGLEPSPFIDYDYDFGAEGDFDYSFANDSSQMIGALPGTSSDGDNDLHDKRSHPDDEEDEEGGGKRREGDDKSSKKPGRKPLTSEPTTVSTHLFRQQNTSDHHTEAKGTKPTGAARISRAKRETPEGSRDKS